MSSEEEELARTGGKSRKKRRVGRACDMCRQKKVRCDGEQGRRCTNCITFDDECTYVHSAPKRRTRPRGYVERLETRVSQMEELLNKICPGFDLLGDFGAAVEESSKINNDYEDSDDDGEGNHHLFSGSAGDLDFSHAIPPSLGSPPPPLPPHARKDSLQAMSPVPASAPFGFSIPLQSRSSSLDAHIGPTHTDGLSESDDELTLRHSLADKLANILDHNTGYHVAEPEQDLNSPMSSSSHDQDRTGRPSSSTGSPRPTSSKSRPPSSRLEMATLDKRFFGKSSAFTILKTAVDMKNEYWKSAGIVGGGRMEDLSALDSPDRSQDDHTSSALNMSNDAPSNTNTSGQDATPRYLPCGCPQYGPCHPWAQPQAPANHVFPHASLLRALVASYFDIQNTFVPVLHRPTLEQGIKEGRHKREEDFGNVVLLVCALGSRWCTDRTALLGVGDDSGRLTEQERSAGAFAHGGSVQLPDMGPESVQDDFWREGEDDEEWHSAGWKWFKQVYFGKKALYAPPSVLTLQALCLASIYLRGSSSPEASRWSTGVGLRLAQDMGAHRKKSYSPVPTVDEELMKKAWWALVWQDWALSPALGRPAGIQHEDFDVDLLVECDDEYWRPSDPNAPAFVQPPGKPASVTFFNCMLKLNQIQAYALRTIYSTSKSRTILGFTGPQWEERIVTELDSALNSWLDSLPEHLKWDPRNPNTTFLSQSAVLYCAYYALQITIHRPFIASERGASPVSSKFPAGSSSSSRFPSLSICTNAARSCVHVSEILCRRLGHGTHASLGVLHHNVIPLFTSGIVLMLNMWAGADAQKHNGQRNTAREMKEMADVHRAMDILKVMEVRWHTAGRLWDMLYELAVVSDLPLPSSSHAAVIRSIKQNRRQMPKQPAKASGEADSTAAANQRLIRPVPTPGPVSGSSQRPASSHNLRSLDNYRADPVSTWCEYDLTPSVFSQPQAAPKATEPMPLANPVLDSMFTSRSRTSGQASESQASTSAVPARIDASTLSVNSDFGMLFTPRGDKHAPMQNAFASTSGTTHTNLPAKSSDSGFLPPSNTRPPLDTITQVLDSIQLRHADWSMTQAEGDALSMDPTLGWTTGVTSPDMDSIPAMPGNMYPPSGGSQGQAAVAGASQEAVAMWSAAPEDFNWDEWGSYINSMGSHTHGHPQMQHSGHSRHVHNPIIPSHPSQAVPPHHHNHPHDPAFLGNL